MLVSRFAQIEAELRLCAIDSGRPPSVPAVVWGSTVLSASSVTVLSRNSPQFKHLHDLLTENVSRHEVLARCEIMNDVVERFAIRRGLLKDLKVLAFSPSDMRCQIVRTGRYPCAKRLCTPHDRRSHVNMFIDFFSFFVVQAVTFREVMTAFCSAYEYYARLVDEHEQLLTAEGALSVTDAVFAGRIFSRFQNRVGQHQWLPDSCRWTNQKKALVSPATIAPPGRALYRLRFFDAVGFRFVAPSSRGPSSSGLPCPGPSSPRPSFPGSSFAAVSSPTSPAPDQSAASE